MTESVTDRAELLSDPSGADTSAPDPRNRLNMEFSSDSMTINSFDIDYPTLEKVVISQYLSG